MSYGLEARLERLHDRLSPSPPELSVIVIFNAGGMEHLELMTPSVDTPRPEIFAIGKYAVCLLVGGTPQDRRSLIERLRQDAKWNHPDLMMERPVSPAALTEATKAIQPKGGRGESEGENAYTPVPTGQKTREH
jgi:hypothetical protein